MKPDPLQTLRVALVHDWLTGMRGGEKCLEIFCEIFPRADIYTLFHFPGSVSATIERHPIHTTWIQRLPGLTHKYRNYLPLFPLALEGLSLQGYDLILSSSHCVAKDVRRHPPSRHVSYVFTPIRYVWDMYDIYFGRESGTGMLPRAAMAVLAPLLRKWDVYTCRRVDHFLADSLHVRRRILRYYGREAEVVPIPVDTRLFDLAHQPRDYYLIVSALVPYKRVDLAVKAFNRLGRPLLIVGSGPQRAELERLSGSNITWAGWAAADQLRRFYGECRALIFPGEEDAGITPLEAQASGRPVVAFGKGGALETVVSLEEYQAGKSNFFSGVFFPEQTEEALIEAVERLEAHAPELDREKIRAHALTFDREVFKRKIQEKILEKMGI
ncbi:MAG: glycosyltransferase [Desulfobacterota bacterium]|jgi:glycosyltransferase involved in cell wall biosynthesis|nr:glycosyltransferase [Thermodesulfobacteriota bacterium]